MKRKEVQRRYSRIQYSHAHTSRNDAREGGTTTYTVSRRYPALAVSWYESNVLVAQFTAIVVPLAVVMYAG